VLAIAGFGDKAFKPIALVAIKSANAATADHLLIDFLPRVTTGGVYKRSRAVKREILGVCVQTVHTPSFWRRPVPFRIVEVSLEF
jgi:hypothetical protein